MAYQGPKRLGALLSEKKLGWKTVSIVAKLKWKWAGNFTRMTDRIRSVNDWAPEGRVREVGGQMLRTKSSLNTRDHINISTK